MRRRSGQTLLEHAIGLVLVIPVIFITGLLIANTTLTLLYKEKLSVLANQTASRIARRIRFSPAYAFTKAELDTPGADFAQQIAGELGLKSPKSVDVTLKNNVIIVVTIEPASQELITGGGIFPKSITLKERGVAITRPFILN